MSKPIDLPNEVVASTVNAIRKINQDEELEVIVIAAKEGVPPNIASTMCPHCLPFLLLWLLQNHSDAEIHAEKFSDQTN